MGDKGYIRGPFGSALKRAELKDSGIPVYEQQHAIDGTRTFRYFVDEDKYSELRRFTVEANDLIISCSGTVGRISVIQPSDPKGIISQALLILRPDTNKVLPHYLYYFLTSRVGARELVNASQGAVQLNIAPRNIVEKIPVPLPSDIEIQKAIVNQLKVVDDKIDINRRINQTLEAMAQAIFKSWFVDFDPVKAKIAAKAEGRDPLRAAMTAISGKPDAELDTLPPDQFAPLAATAALFPDEMEDSALGEIPKGWNVGTFKDCCLRVESGGTPSRKEPGFWGGSIPWLTSGEVRDVVVLDTKEKISRAGLDASSAKLWPAISTVVAMYGATAGQVCLIANEMTANQACCALIPKAAFKTFIFVAARHSVQQLAEKASGSAQQNLNKSLVENHVHVIPDKGVAEGFEMTTTSLLQKWVLNQREAATLAQLRDNLLPKLLSGELQVQSAEAEVAA